MCTRTAYIYRSKSGYHAFQQNLKMFQTANQFSSTALRLCLNRESPCAVNPHPQDYTCMHMIKSSLHLIVLEQHITYPFNATVYMYVSHAHAFIIYGSLKESIANQKHKPMKAFSIVFTATHQATTHPDHACINCIVRGWSHITRNFKLTS